MRRTKITAFIAPTAVSAFLLVLSFTPLAGGATKSKLTAQENQNPGARGNITQYPDGAPPPTPTPTPALGNYPDTSVSLSGDTTVTPDAAPTNATTINVSTNSN